ncbi:MAG: hypothetical protein M5U28_28360 [Sandaracinaceae bacterium]|nr:hypothetical protein [Sandaracinaceae bacterium]
MVRMLSGPASPRLVATLRMRKIAPLSVGRAIVATRDPHERLVREAIRALGLSLTITRNLDALMVLPRGKSTGGSGGALSRCEAQIAPRTPWPSATARRNDEALQAQVVPSRLGSALESALSRRRADLVTDAGESGAVELDDRTLEDDLSRRSPVRAKARQLG